MLTEKVTSQVLFLVNGDALVFPFWPYSSRFGMFCYLSRYFVNGSMRLPKQVDVQIYYQVPARRNSAY